ncbi:unnamed protein product [Owenia fusiformis]|uniref:Uncharacterized protein n=1 Tax=Owenia fusiformis TaxID=6347 RepID=A0A8J1TC12_OWEFU|nr:unnamed protein product [Owenia fusiformis]
MAEMSQERNSSVLMDQGITVTVSSNGSLKSNFTKVRTVDILIVSYLSPIVLILGTIGNALSIAVFYRKKFRRNTASVYLITLAVVDTFGLWVGLFPYWLPKISHISDIELMNTWACSILIFLGFLSIQLSAWTLVLVTFERLLAVFAPLKAKVIFNIKWAVVILVSVFAVLLGLNLHILWNFDLQLNIANETECGGTSEAYISMHAWMNAVIASYLPSFLMFSANIAIIAKMLRRRRSGLGSSNQIASMTIILLLCNFSFICLTFPLAVYYAFYLQWYPQSSEKRDIHEALVILLAFSNQAINFPLYCASGQTFRDEMKKMFHKWKSAICGRGNSVTDVLQMNTNTLNSNTN